MPLKSINLSALNPLALYRGQTNKLFSIIDIDIDMFGVCMFARMYKKILVNAYLFLLLDSVLMAILNMKMKITQELDGFLYNPYFYPY